MTRSALSAALPRIRFTLACAAVWSAGGAAAQSNAKPETLIKWRQSTYQAINWNTSRIKTNLDGTYNKDEVLQAANAIQALANAGLPSLFPPGTESGKGWRDTAVKPAFFSDSKRAGELQGNFSQEAAELVKVATSGDAGAVKTQFGKLTRSCKACHDDFRAKD